VADFVSWDWVSGRTLRFRPVAAFPLSNAQGDTFRMLCDTLVANFPGITQRPDEPGHIRTYNISPSMDIEWFLREQVLSATTGRLSGGRSEHLHPARLQRLYVVGVQGTSIIPSLECGPALTRLVWPWRGLRPWEPKRRPQEHPRQGAPAARLVR
jgi:hypothetical protein